MCTVSPWPFQPPHLDATWSGCLQKSLQALPRGFSRHSWNPAQANVIFAWGNAVGGDVEFGVQCSVFKALFKSDGVSPSAYSRCSCCCCWLLNAQHAVAIAGCEIG